MVMASFGMAWPGMPDDFPVGAIIGVVRLESVGQPPMAGEARWEHESCGSVRWALSNPRAVMPFYKAGRRGIFYVDFCLEPPI
jgi:hypothetical protein